MNVLIVEDEQLAADRLLQIVNKTNSNINVVGQTDTIRDTVAFLNNESNQVDLIFCDIHLADGSSFEIFKQVEVDKPVIFTTAYDQYSIDAFKINSIDYLLKPIKEKDVNQSLEKFEKYFQPTQTLDIDAITQLMNPSGNHKKRFLVRSGIKLIPKKMEDIGLIFVENKVVQFIDLFNEKLYLLDFTLDELMNNELDNTLFFRINRSQIINIEAIASIKPHYNQRLSLSLKIPTRQEMIVSREKVNDFKKWFLR